MKGLTTWLLREKGQNCAYQFFIGCLILKSLHFNLWSPRSWTSSKQTQLIYITMENHHCSSMQIIYKNKAIFPLHKLPTGPETGPACLCFLSCMAVFEEEKMCILPWVVHWNMAVMSVNSTTNYSKVLFVEAKTIFHMFQWLENRPYFWTCFVFSMGKCACFRTISSTQLAQPLRSACTHLVTSSHKTPLPCFAVRLDHRKRLVKLLGIIRLQDFQHNINSVAWRVCGSAWELKCVDVIIPPHPNPIIWT